MLRFIRLQLTATIVVSALAGLIAGKFALISALLGGLCCIVPNSLFAFRLYADSRGGRANMLTVFTGEIIKILATVALMAASVRWFRDLNWLEFLTGLIVALKSSLIFLFKH